MRGAASKESPKSAPKVNVGKSSLYKYLQNQLVIMTFIIQTFIVISYLTIWFKSQVLIRGLLRNNIGAILEQSGVALVQVQNLNIAYPAQRLYAEMDSYSLAFSSILIHIADPTAELPNIASLSQFDKSTEFGTVGFWVDGRTKQPSYDSLSDYDTLVIDSMSGYLKWFTDSLDDQTDDLSSLAAVGILNTSASFTKEAITVIMPLKSYTLNTNEEFFSFADSCSLTSLCKANCQKGDVYLLKCLAKGSGLSPSPLYFHNSNPAVDEELYLFSTVVSDTITLLLFVSDLNETIVNNRSMVPASKSSVFIESAFANIKNLHPLVVAEARSDTFSLYQRPENEILYTRFLNSYFTSVSNLSIHYNQAGDFVEYSGAKATFEGLNIVSAVSLAKEVFSFLVSSDNSHLHQYEINEELGQVASLILFVFVLGVAATYYFVYQTVLVVLQCLVQVRNFMIEGSPFDISEQQVKYKEMNAMLKEIKYYQMLVSFIKTIKSKDSNNRHELSKFLKPIEVSNNLSAQVYLFNYFMKELSEKSMEKPAPSRMKEIVDEGSEKVSELDQSIQYGQKLYSTYDKMIASLISSGSYSEFELRRMNLSIFRLFEVMIGLMMKSAKLKLDYTYEDALWLYERTYRFVDQLNLNDTIRLGLLLKKAKLLLHLKKFSAAEELLEELEGMLALMLKNHRVLMYMEDEYKLLTYYHQQYLDLKSEFFYRKQSFKDSKEYILKVLDYGDVFNVRARLKSLKRLTKIVKKGPRMTEAVERTVREITNIAKFITNRNRNIVLMFDVTEKFIEHIDKIKEATFKMLEAALQPSDCVSMYGFDRKLHIFKEAMSLPMHDDDIENEYEISNLYSFVTEYFEFLRKKVVDHKREYYANLEECLQRNQKAITLRMAGNSPIHRRLSANLESPDGLDNSDSSDLETGPESPVTGPLYLILGVFGKHYPQEELNGLGHSGTGFHSRTSWDPQKQPFRQSTDELPSLNASNKKLPPLVQKKSTGESWFSGGNKNKSLGIVEKTIDTSMVNFMLITSCMQKVQKENILPVLAKAKRSLVYDLGSSDSPELDKTLKEFVD